MKSFKPALLALLLLVAGCTYSFRGQSAGAIKSVGVPTFENESAEFGLGERVTNDLITAIQRDGVLRVTTPEQADAVLHGRIVRVEDVPYTARADQSVQEYRFSMALEVDLVDNRTQNVIWTQTFPEWAIYPYSGSLANRDAAITEAVGKLQQDLVNRIVGNW
jgi:hypothetical protein